jgi:signal transduction histidine kinase
MMRSTQRQVAALVAVSVLVAYGVTIGLVIALRGTPSNLPHSPDMRALRIVASLYAAHPEMRTELLARAAESGLDIRAFPDSEVRACAAAPGGAACAPELSAPDMAPVQATSDTWLVVMHHDRPPMPPHRITPGIRLAGLLAVIGLPTLALSLWASRRVTAPLLRLAAQAERVDPETIAAPLPVEGTTEIRLLAETFNRLILRLTRYAAEQRRMLAAVSHDLRTPLTRLRLRAETAADPALRLMLVRDADVMQVLIDHSLQLLQAQDRAADLTWVDLPALLQTVADDMTDAGAKVAVGVLPPVTAQCNAPMLTRAIENLVDNAAKYGGGSTLLLRQAGGAAVIEVADTGPGLSDADKELAFEPWYRGDEARGDQGNGLGLAIVKTLMAAQDGRVDLADNEPHGLLARLILPVSQLRVPAAEKTVNPAQAVSAS